MCELTDQTMRDAEAAARQSRPGADMMFQCFGPALARAAEQAEKIHRAAELCRLAEREEET